MPKLGIERATYMVSIFHLCEHSDAPCEIRIDGSGNEGAVHIGIALSEILPSHLEQLNSLVRLK